MTYRKGVVKIKAVIDSLWKEIRVENYGEWSLVVGQIPGVVENRFRTASELYIADPEAQEPLLSALIVLGYEVEDKSNPGRSRAAYRWYARLRESGEEARLRRAVKCRSCGNYIKRFGVHTRERTCEHCSAHTLTEEGQPNYVDVKIFDGDEYGEHEVLPLPEGLTIYAIWEWPNTAATWAKKIIRASGMPSRLDYYSQSHQFDNRQIERMRRFVRLVAPSSLAGWEEEVAGIRNCQRLIWKTGVFCRDHLER